MAAKTNIPFNSNWTGNSGTTNLTAQLSANTSVVDRVLTISVEGTGANSSAKATATVTQKGVSGTGPYFKNIVNNVTATTEDLNVMADWKMSSFTINHEANIYVNYAGTTIEDGNVTGSSVQPNISTSSTVQFGLSNNTASVTTAGTIEWLAYNETGSTGTSVNVNVYRYMVPTLTLTTSSGNIPNTGGTFEITAVTNYSADCISISLPNDCSYTTQPAGSQSIFTITVPPNSGTTQRSIQPTITVTPAKTGLTGSKNVYLDPSVTARTTTVTQTAGGISTSNVEINSTATAATVSFTSSFGWKISEIYVNTTANSWVNSIKSGTTVIAPYNPSQA